MPANKNKLLRLQTILAMMRKRQYPNYTSFLREMRRQDVAGTFELSAKTFSRDIGDLKADFAAPIRYDTVKKGFYLTDCEWYSRALMVEPVEMRHVLLGQRVAEGIMQEPMRGANSRAVNALLMHNETGLAYGTCLDSLQVFDRNKVPVPPELFTAIAEAWEKRLRLRLEYCSAQGRASFKVFDPQLLAWQDGTWYLKGEQHSVDGVLCDPAQIVVLAVHRIRQAHTTGAVFEANSELCRETARQGLFNLPRYPVIELECAASSAQRMLERFPDAAASEHGDAVTLRLEDIPCHEAVGLVLDGQGDIRALAPAELRENIRRIARKLAETD